MDDFIPGVLQGVGNYTARGAYVRYNFIATDTTLNTALGDTQAIELTSLGAGNQDIIGVSYEAYEWSQFDWNNNGMFDGDPSATATLEYTEETMVCTTGERSLDKCVECVGYLPSNHEKQ